MTGPRRRRAPEQARQEILDAAAELIARHGPDGVGLRRVAEAVGISHGLVTHCFGTYSALVRAVPRARTSGSGSGSANGCAPITAYRTRTA
ncbi:helix-turn-helix domain-containing protein [Streptomyces sp. LUP30]|uniref:helix-turn-helix domain-containing protein n=1 Tax=Streptomyces sp. LUP30 TaxID=1890285 RepID=UPI000851CE31|nr:helix-turn-helix domain-containing protein [Streptomyces sp. LUP30]